MISETGVYGLRALAALASLPEGDVVGAASIAKQIGAPPNYLGKLLQTLSRAGLVASQKGLGGGFRLARDPHRITLIDVLEPLERVSRWKACFLGRKRCGDNNPCAVHEQWREVRESYLQFLETTSIADLADDSRRRGRGGRERRGTSLTRWSGTRRAAGSS